MINYELERKTEDNDKILHHSKLFGNIVTPLDFFNKYKLNDSYYLGQLNLSEIDSKYLSLKGMLYIFLDFKKYKIIPHIVYTEEDLAEVYDKPNEMFGDLCFNDALYMNFNKGESNYILGEIDQDLESYVFNQDDYLCLLKIDPLNILASDFPTFFNPDDELYFLIKKEDLAKNNFKKILLINYGS